MRKLFISFIALTLLAGTAFAEGEFRYFKKKAAAGGGGYATPTRTGGGSAYATAYAPNWTITAGEMVIVGITGGRL